eukprot:TRINITY_DN151_c0_g1_i1.p1 TRINITY_DN151_c0_g1~~TRINITY_DN151_c0_g1_i1.p1  ORF type:complete len:361 (-),score=74.77 TRINITY_DN151_c0_g1_i1:57-1139(-)
MAAVREEFLDFFAAIADDIQKDAAQHELPQHSMDWIQKCLEYTVPGGKMTRGIGVYDTVVHYFARDLIEEEKRLAFVAGWLIEMLQALLLIADDIMDASTTRRGKQCWYKKVGMVAINDAFLIQSFIYRVLQKHFHSKPYYMKLVETFQYVTYMTELGQLLDSTNDDIHEADYSHFTPERCRKIATQKTAYYTFYLPVATGLILCGCTEEDTFKEARDILIEIGCYFQAADDILDCYGDPKKYKKGLGSDIIEGKCTWIAVEFLSMANKEQRSTFSEHYGKNCDKDVERIFALYKEAAMHDYFKKYEEDFHKVITKQIESAKKVPKMVYSAIFDTVYKREAEEHRLNSSHIPLSRMPSSA